MEKLYTMAEVAKMLTLSTRTIQNYLKNGKLTGKKIGSQWRFSEEDISKLFSEKEFVDEHYEIKTKQLEEFVSKDSLEKSEGFTILNYPYNPNFEIEDLMLKIEKFMKKYPKLTFYFIEKKSIFQFFLKGDIKDLGNFQELINNYFEKIA